MSLAARLEGLVFPIRFHQSIQPDSVVHRSNRLCWTWVSDKERLTTSDNVNIFLDGADGDRSYPKVLDRLTSTPWHRKGAVPVGLL